MNKGIIEEAKGKILNLLEEDVDNTIISTNEFEAMNPRETVPSQTSDMGEKTFSVLAHSFLLP